MGNLDRLDELSLVCPACFQPVRRVERKYWCTNPECRRSYPIDDADIPHMLISEATVEATPAPGP